MYDETGKESVSATDASAEGEDAGRHRASPESPESTNTSSGSTKRGTLLKKTRIREAMQILRTNIQFSSADDAIHTIAVTSPEPGAGKSFTAVNLALTFATSGQKTLLIDCDLRRPTVHQSLSISNRRGLSNYLVGNMDLPEVIQEFPEWPDFDVIPSGPVPPNPPQLFESSHFDTLLKEARENYDMVVFDTPPLNLVADALVLSRKVDGAILVCREGQTTYKDIREAVESLRQAKVRILGTILNYAANRSGKSHYYTDD